MTDGYVIRTAEGDADLSAIFDLLLLTGLSTVRARITATLETCTYWLALAADDVVACLGLEHGEGASLLRSAAVVPDHRGRGIGVSLTSTAIDHARERGDRQLYLFSSHAGPYWQRFGFIPVSVWDVARALPDVPQVQSGLTRGWLEEEQGYRLDL